MVNKKVIVNILINLLKFEESWKELTRGTAKLEHANDFVKYFWSTSIDRKCVKKWLFLKANCFGEFTILS